MSGELLRYKSKGTKVLELQEKLTKLGYNVGTPDGVFGLQTQAAVKAFQASVGLDPDGVVGNMTWVALDDKTKIVKYDSLRSSFIEYHMNDDEYYKEVVEKDCIVIHHTAGAARPDYVIQGWENDKSSYGGVLRVGTAFVIGGKTTGAGDFDGVVYRAFHEKYWSHHLGVERPKYKKYQNTDLNAKSIAIEICSFGQLVKEGTSFFADLGVKKVPIAAEEVCMLETPWRGYLYYQRYTEKQIESLRKLILDIAMVYKIKLPNRVYNRDFFDLKFDALNGEGGLWTHVNFREDKTDCFPQPELINMLNGLYPEHEKMLQTV